MPYISNEALPAPLRRHLPPKAQSVYREAFNHAWTTHELNRRCEEIAHRVAWAAVKRHWHKGADGNWVPGGSVSG
jgi:cation transport regulator